MFRDVGEATEATRAVEATEGSGVTKSGPLFSIFVVDDHAIVRQGLRVLIESQPDFRVFGEAEHGRDACAQLGALPKNRPDLLPDLALLDMSMPHVGGLETTVRIRQQWPSIKVLVLTMHEDRSYLRSLLEAGASGYLLKRSAADELVYAIRSVLTGGTYVDPQMGMTLVQTLLSKSERGSTGTNANGEDTGQVLSDREAQVLRLVAEGYVSKEIAAQLAISAKTVETYRTRAMKKLGLDNRVQLIRYAKQVGWLRNPSL